MKKLLVLIVLAFLVYFFIFSNDTTANRSEDIVLPSEHVDITCNFIHNKLRVTVKTRFLIEDVHLNVGEYSRTLEKLDKGWSFMYIISERAQSGVLDYKYNGNTYRKVFYCS